MKKPTAVPTINVQQAVQIAKASATEILEASSAALEEIERDTYRDKEICSITLSLPRDLDQLSPLVRIATTPLQYKRLLIDAETGEMLAILIREIAGH